MKALRYYWLLNGLIWNSCFYVLFAVNCSIKLINRSRSQEDIGARVEFVDFDRFGYWFLFKSGENKIEYQGMIMLIKGGYSMPNIQAIWLSMYKI